MDLGQAASHLPRLGSTINTAAANWLIPEPKPVSFREGLRREAQQLPDSAVLSPLYRAVAEDPVVLDLTRKVRNAKTAQERLQLRAKLAEAERLAAQRLAGTVGARELEGRHQWQSHVALPGGGGGGGIDRGSLPYRADGSPESSVVESTRGLLSGC